MSTSLNRWRLFCATENKYVYNWVNSNDSPPTLCPHDSAHTITSTLTVIVEQRSSNSVSIEQENAGLTGGHYRWHTSGFTAVANTQTTHQVSFPYPINVLSASVQTAEENRGDSLAWYVLHNTPIAVTSVSIPAGTNTFTISAPSLANCFIGMKINITKSGETDALGYIRTINTEAGTLTTSVASQRTFDPPSQIRISVAYLDDVELGNPMQMDLGQAKISGTFLAADTLLTCIYTNRGNTDKRILGNFEFLY